MHVLQGPWHYGANNDDHGGKELRSRLIGGQNVQTITTILLEKHEAVTLEYQQIQQQQQETEKERLKRAAREFQALLKSFAPHWGADMAKVFRGLLRKHNKQHLQPQTEETAATVAQAPAAVEQAVPALASAPQ